ncbi:MAG: hypothetical protein ACREJM_04905 [Candidatus Saccharimonadales bacterium]
MNKIGFLALSSGLLAALIAAPSDAQTINQKARQKASWYNTPREIQIIDERPVVRDFREAPTNPQSIQLPPGPGEHRGMYGGGGGAMPDAASVIPAGGMPIGGDAGDHGYRLPNDTNPVPLDHGDLAHRPSNIPAGGIGQKGPLPGGFTTGIHGKVSAPNYPQGLAAGPAPSGPHRSGPMAAAKPVATYNPSVNSYGPSVGTGSGAGGASTNVRGKLLNLVK